MDFKKLENECNEILGYLSSTEPGSKEYETAVKNLATLDKIKTDSEEMAWKQKLELGKAEQKAVEDKRRYELDKSERLGKLELEKEERKRRYELDRDDKKKRLEYEKAKTDIDIEAKRAEIALNKRKVDIDELDREQKRNLELRKIELDEQKLALDRERTIKELKIKAASIESELAVNQAIIQEKIAAAEKANSKIAGIGLPILQSIAPVLGALGAVVMTVRDEETRCITSKGLTSFKAFKM